MLVRLTLYGDVGLQFLGAEVQKAQDVVIVVSGIPRAESVATSNAIRILITGTSPISANASHAAMLEIVRAWKTK